MNKETQDKIDKKICFMCGKRLNHQPKLEKLPAIDPTTFSMFKKVGTKGYGYAANGYFCTMRCGFDFAVNVMKEFKYRKAQP